MTFVTDFTNEQWRPIPGHEGFYSVSDLGRVRSEDRIIIEANTGNRQPHEGVILKPWINNGGAERGYTCVRLCRNNIKYHIRIHQAMMWAFIGPQKKGIDVMHLDGNSRNNVLTNLKYGTRQQNLRDAVALGTMRRPLKLDAENVLEICKMGREKVSSKFVAEKFNLARSTVTEIWRGDIWDHVTEGFRPESNQNIKYTKLTEEDIKLIKSRSKTVTEVAKILGYDRHAVSRWRKKFISESQVLS